MVQLLTAGDIGVGDQVPAMSVAITTKMVIMGATASRDWQPLHHDVEWAQQSAGLPNIILNNYTQLGLFNRYLTDWCGPVGRIGRIKIRMRTPICPGDTAVFQGCVSDVSESGDLVWLDMDLSILVNGRTVTDGSARLALPASSDAPSPWRCPDSAWAP